MDAIILCRLCGRSLSNDPTAPNVAEWTLDTRDPYCADDCIRTVYAVDHSVRPAIDRAIERDHSICGAEPCSDCR